MKGIEAGTIGSKTYTKTVITVGSNAHLFNEMETAKRQIVQIDTDIAKCSQIIAFLNAKRMELGKIPEDEEQIFQSASATVAQREVEKQTLLARVEEIKIALTEKQYLELKCRREVFPGVTIKLNDYTYAVNQPLKACRFILGETGIEYRGLF
ncbi:MAG: FapA family protein [Oscillospiraceae bacterium]